MATVTIIPQPAQVPTVGPGGQQAGSATETTGRAPTLQPGTQISGTIAGKDATGNYLLRTSQGTLTVQSSAPLTYNSDVTIQIDNANAGATNARIVTVNGEPFSSFSTPEPQQGDTLSPSLLAQTQQAAAPAPQAALPPPTDRINALVVTPAVAQTPDSGEANTPVANGTPVVIRVTATPEGTTQQTSSTAVTPPARDAASLAPPAAVQAQTSAQEISEAQTPATVARTAAPQQADIPQNAPAPATLPQTQQQPAPSANAFYAAYTKQAPVSSPAAQPASPQPENATTAVQGQVANINDDGTIAVKTPIGVLTVQISSTPASASSLVTGASVSIELPAASIVQNTPLATLATPQSATPAPLPELATSWSTLKDILTLLASTDPPATSQAASNDSSSAASALLARLPQLGPDFASSSLAFLSAMSQNDTRRLLGDDAIETLKNNGRADLIEKFSGEMENISQAMTTAANRQTPTWQAMVLPFVYQEEIQQARLYVKREAPKKERATAAQAKGDMRFVVEVDLTELGPLQMDGLVRDKLQSTVFDLMIRSHTPFSREDQAAITGIYNNAAMLTGFSGSIGFQVTRDFPVKPLEEAAFGIDHSIIV